MQTFELQGDKQPALCVQKQKDLAVWTSVKAEYILTSWYIVPRALLL